MDHYGFGIHWMEVKDFTRAEFSFLKALESNANFADAYIQLGMLYYILYEKEISSNKNPEITVRYYNLSYNCLGKAKELSPQNPRIYTGLARLQMVAGQFDKAIENLLKGRQYTEPEDIATEVIICLELGNCYLSLGKHQKALEEYKESLNFVTDKEERKNIDSIIREIEKHILSHSVE